MIPFCIACTLGPAAVDAGRFEVSVGAVAGTVNRGPFGVPDEANSEIGAAVGALASIGVRIAGATRIGVQGGYEGFVRSDRDRSPGIWTVGPWLGARWGKRYRVNFVIAGGFASAETETYMRRDYGEPWEWRSAPSQGFFFDIRVGPSVALSRTTELFLEFGAYNSRRLTVEAPYPYIPHREWFSVGTAIIPLLGSASCGVRAYF